MIHVYDLHFKKEIFPLFDHLHNEHARDALRQLLAETPVSLEEIYQRQHIAKAMLQHRHLYAPFAYSKVEFNQVYAYIEEKKNRKVRLTGASLKVHYLFARSERHREQGGLYQFFYFFNRVEDYYFSRLRIDRFPEAFQQRLKNVMQMLSDLQVAKHYNIARSRGLTFTELVHLAELLQDKVDKGEMDAFLKDFFYFEAWHSIAKGINENNFNFPEFREGALIMTEFYHPLLKYPVRNSIQVQDAVTLITGPNMSGKSTLLKSIGLCVYLAHLGLAVPAEICELPFFDTISIAINLNDDIKNGYSHFMTEIQTLKKMVIEARGNKRCFAIFDELFRGTNIEDALAISKMTIQGLTAFTGSFFFISTHLHQLEHMARDIALNTCCIDCDLGNGRPVFTYKLKPGWSDLKLGQIIFKQEGLDELLAPPRPLS